MLKPKRPCRKPGCPRLTTDGWCHEHKPKNKNKSGHKEPHVLKWLNGSRYKKARAALLKEQPLCAKCKDVGRVTPANVLDHIVPHKGNPALFWDKKNWQALCKRCHDKKTYSEGAFGRK